MLSKSGVCIWICQILAIKSGGNVAGVVAGLVLLGARNSLRPARCVGVWLGKSGKSSPHACSGCLIFQTNSSLTNQNLARGWAKQRKVLSGELAAAPSPPSLRSMRSSARGRTPTRGRPPNRWPSVDNVPGTYVFILHLEFTPMHPRRQVLADE